MKLFALLFLVTLTSWRAAAAPAIAMHGGPAENPNSNHFAYVNPDAPKGGRLVLGRTGGFASMQHFIVRGARGAGRHLSHQSLLARGQDEPFTLYALIAEDVSTPPNRSSVTFRLRPGARFHDGSEITVNDVIFSHRTLRAKGRPNHRYFYGQVATVETSQPRTVTFRFKDNTNREMPLIMGMMPILSKASFASRRFDRVSLESVLGSGPYLAEKVDPGHSIQYRRLPNYWARDLAAQRGQHNFDVVRYDYFRDDTAMLEAFKAGKIDVRLEHEPQFWTQAYDITARRDGRINLIEFEHGRPAGMFGVVLNTRRRQFRDPRVREALANALDFEWLNKTLFHDAYHRTRSYFENSELAATQAPSRAELALLAPYRASLPGEIFTTSHEPPKGGGQVSMRDRLRANLRRAAKLLAAAGWRIKDLQLRHEDGGAAFEFEIILRRRSNERLALHLARNLEKLGIAVQVRLVDGAQYQQRTNTFDFDAIFHRWEPSLSPGNEQAYYWGSAAADNPGSRNYPGIRVPAIDALIGRISDAPDRASLVTAVRAMDRILQGGHYVVPLFHQKTDRVALWDKFGRPDRTPLYGFRLETWWAKSAKLK